MSDLNAPPEAARNEIGAESDSDLSLVQAIRRLHRIVETNSDRIRELESKIEEIGGDTLSET